VRQVNWPSRHLRVAAILIAASFAAVAVGAGIANGASHHLSKKHPTKKHPAKKHPTCLQMFPASAASSLAGRKLTLWGGVDSAKQTQPWQYKEGSSAQVTAVGTVCIYKNPGDPPSGWPINAESIVGLGFGGKPALWRKFQGLYKSGLGWFNGHWNVSTGAYSKITLSVPSSAFLLTYDDWTPFGLDASSAPPDLPQNYYVVFAMSKRDNLLMLSCMGATLAQTEQAAVSILRQKGF